jgi:hypothetical protein
MRPSLKKKNNFSSLKVIYTITNFASDMGYFTEGGIATYSCGGYAILGVGGQGFFFSRTHG